MVFDIGSIISQVYFVPETTTLYDQLQALEKGVSTLQLLLMNMVILEE